MEAPLTAGRTAIRRSEPPRHSLPSPNGTAGATSPWTNVTNEVAGIPSIASTTSSEATEEVPEPRSSAPLGPLEECRHPPSWLLTADCAPLHGQDWDSQ